MSLVDSIKLWVADVRDKLNSHTPRLIPLGGPKGAVLTKASAADIDIAWVPPTTVGSPVLRSLVPATAYQATDKTKAAIVTLNLTSTALLSLTGGQTHSADIVIGATSAVATGTGVAIGKYSSSLTGALTVGLNLSNTGAAPITFALPAGWYFAIRVTSGTVTVTSAYDQVSP